VAKARLRNGVISAKTGRSFLAATGKLKEARRRVGTAFSLFGARAIGEEIMADIKNSSPGHGVPVDTGALRATGQVTVTGTGSRQHVMLSFGGAAVLYARIQHEVLWFRHKVGEARYLVRGMERWRRSTSRAWQALRGEIYSALRGG
jgi:hypothetical protein